MDHNRVATEDFRVRTEEDSDQEIIKVVLEVEIIREDLDQETTREISEEVTDHRVTSESDKNHSRIFFIILEAILVRFFQFALWFL